MREIPLGPIVFVLAIGIAMVGAAAWMSWTARAMEAWPSTDGTVLETQVRRRTGLSVRRGGNTVLFGPYIKYRYRVNAKEHVGDRIGLVSWENSNEESVKSFLAPYPVGSKVKVQYDPQDSSSAVIAGQHSWLNLIFLATGTAIIAVSLALLKVRRQRLARA